MCNGVYRCIGLYLFICYQKSLKLLTDLKSNYIYRFGRYPNVKNYKEVWHFKYSLPFCIQVVLYNRQDCCSERLNNFIISVGDSEIGTENQFCVLDGGDTTGKYEIINKCTTPIRGRYVHVMVKGTRDFALCEIQVNGSFEGMYHSQMSWKNFETQYLVFVFLQTWICQKTLSVTSKCFSTYIVNART